MKIVRENVGIANLQTLLSKGDEIYVVNRSVSASGMSRKVSVFAIVDGRLNSITHSVALALDTKVTDDSFGNRVITLKGAGMDMHFKLVYDLGLALFGDGYALRKQTI
jgi:hypothetical protein